MERQLLLSILCLFVQCSLSNCTRDCKVIGASRAVGPEYYRVYSNPLRRRIEEKQEDTVFALSMDLTKENTVLQNLFQLVPPATPMTGVTLAQKLRAVLDLATGCAQNSSGDSMPIDWLTNTMRVNYVSANGALVLKSNLDVSKSLNVALTELLDEEPGAIVPQVFVMDYPNPLLLKHIFILNGKIREVSNLQRMLERNHSEFSAWTGTTWMSQIADYVISSQLFIPGTHDSLAWSETLWCANGAEPYTLAHVMTLQEQLDAGVRWLDIRLARANVSRVTEDSNKLIESIELVGAHGPYLFDYSLTQVLSDVKQFVLNNPSEAVFVNLKLEITPSSLKYLGRCTENSTSNLWQEKQNKSTPVPQILECTADQFLTLFKEAAETAWHNFLFREQIVTPTTALGGLRGHVVIVNNWWDSKLDGDAAHWKDAYEAWSKLPVSWVRDEVL